MCGAGGEEGDDLIVVHQDHQYAQQDHQHVHQDYRHVHAEHQT